MLWPNALMAIQTPSADASQLRQMRKCMHEPSAESVEQTAETWRRIDKHITDTSGQTSDGYCNCKLRSSCGIARLGLGHVQLDRGTIRRSSIKPKGHQSTCRLDPAAARQGARGEFACVGSTCDLPAAKQPSKHAVTSAFDRLDFALASLSSGKVSRRTSFKCTKLCAVSQSNKGHLIIESYRLGSLCYLSSRVQRQRGCQPASNGLLASWSTAPQATLHLTASQLARGPRPTALTALPCRWASMAVGSTSAGVLMGVRGVAAHSRHSM